jgi:DNA modification methylase
VAAKLLGHDFLGIEISPEYTRKALERLANAERERRVILEELELHHVGMTFKERKEKGISRSRFKRETVQPQLFREKSSPKYHSGE